MKWRMCLDFSLLTGRSFRSNNPVRHSSTSLPASCTCVLCNLCQSGLVGSSSRVMAADIVPTSEKEKGETEAAPSNHEICWCGTCGKGKECR